MIFWRSARLVRASSSPSMSVAVLMRNLRNSPDSSGMSQAATRFQSADVWRKAVRIPPSGPAPG